MLATFSNKLSQMESVVKEHSRALMELQTLLQLDAGTDGSTSAGGGSVIVVHRPDATPTRHSSRLLVVDRLLTEIQQRTDSADLQLSKLARKLERHDAEIAELRGKIVWTHAELPASSSSSHNHKQSSTAVPLNPLPGTRHIDVTRSPREDAVSCEKTASQRATSRQHSSDHSYQRHYYQHQHRTAPHLPQAFHVYGGGGGSRRPGAAAGGAVSSAAPGLTYADSVGHRSLFEPIGRPLRPNYQPQQHGHHQHHHHHHPQHHHHQQQQPVEAAVMVDTWRPAGDDRSSTIDRIRSLQAELESRDSHGPTSNSEQQIIARKDKESSKREEWYEHKMRLLKQDKRRRGETIGKLLRCLDEMKDNGKLDETKLSDGRMLLAATVTTRGWSMEDRIYAAVEAMESERVTQRPQSAGDRVDCAHEDHTSQPATQDDIEVRPSAGDAAAQTGAQLAPVSNGASTTTHAAPVPAATAFIAQWKPAITQAWIN